MSRPERNNPDSISGLTDDRVSLVPTISPTGWLGRWVDTSLHLPADLSRERIVARETDRLTTNLAVVLFASQIPRRLGGDATDEELAEDKQRCRRTSWALRQSLRQWAKKIELPDPVPEDLRIAGAGLEWLVFSEQHMATLTEREKIVATWSVLTNQRKWGGGMITRLENERRWITHALR